MDQSSRGEWLVLGRVIITGQLRAVTGLHIGGSAGALAIGNVDQPVVRNPLNGQPYLPGSSLRGKMRSLAEKSSPGPDGRPLPQNHPIGGVTIHVCQLQSDYDQCAVCQVFGVPGSLPGKPNFGGPTRLLVRDIALSGETVRWLDELQTDLPYTEVKWEAAIDRVTSAAVPRQQERVPAGSIFSPLELVYTVYRPEDLDRFGLVLRALQWVEDDYLGGQGSRGSGKVAFEKLRVTARKPMGASVAWSDDELDLADLFEKSRALEVWLRAQILAG